MLNEVPHLASYEKWLLDYRSLEAHWDSVKRLLFSMSSNLSGKGAAVFAGRLTAAVDSGMGSITNIFGSKHYLN